MWDKVLLQNVILYSIILFKNTILKQPYKGVIGIRLCQFKLYNLMFFLFLLLNIHKMYHLINIDTCTHLCPFVSSPFLFPITLTPGPISIYFLSLNINLHFLETYISEITQNEFFFVWLLSLCPIVLRFIQVDYCWVVFRYIEVPQC